MATESSDPRIGLIIRVGVVAVGTLIAVHAGVTAYFDHELREQTYEKIGSIKPEALLSLRAEERQRLASGAMPIDKSMEMLAAKGRLGAGPAIMPSASKDVAPMQGWTQMPGVVPPAMMTPEPGQAPSPSASAAPPGAPSPAPSATPSSGRGPGAAAPAGSNAPRRP